MLSFERRCWRLRMPVLWRPEKAPVSCHRADISAAQGYLGANVLRQEAPRDTPGLFQPTEVVPPAVSAHLPYLGRSSRVLQGYPWDIW
ncbi:hypothetical protein NDU88_004378 [Pleurodeles waltl]|uniref:Uncharacterized protein n=1 Tax=Pleurodeles waltl TaxID=8319 RepID=A0AAV7KXP0_PLEWA|nr:hypothetical protein NDU88_004378 [Pleurodeles waltl]